MKQSEKLAQLLELIFQTPEHDICGKATSYKRTA